MGKVGSSLLSQYIGFLYSSVDPNPRILNELNQMPEGSSDSSLPFLAVVEGESGVIRDK